MRVPLYAPRVSKSLSPAISKSAFARAAHSRNISSPGSRHSFTVPRIFTRMPRARITCSADIARGCSQENFSVRTRLVPQVRVLRLDANLGPGLTAERAWRH